MEEIEDWVTELKWNWVKYVHIGWLRDDRRSTARASGQEVFTKAWNVLQRDGSQHRKIV